MNSSNNFVAEQIDLMGYDTSFLVDPDPDEDLICGICTDLFEAPVVVCSEGCTLCQSCASEVKSPACPLCRKPTAESIISNRLITKIIDKIRTRCVNSGNVVDNGDGDGGDDGAPPAKKIKTSASAAAPVPAVVTTDGCQWIGLIGGLNKHVSKCGFVKVDCPNECNAPVLRNTLMAHMAVCGKRMVVCGGCNFYKMQFCALASHQANTCPKRLLACLNDGCGVSIPAFQVPGHASECGFVKVDCLNHSCFVSVYRHALADHAAVCAARLVACNRCRDPMQAKLLPAHAKNSCLKRSVACPNDGCARAIPADQLPSHRTVCQFQTLKCGFGGGKCNGTYKRGVGSSDHDREASQVHLNIAMGLIDAQTRTIEEMKTTQDEMKRAHAASARAQAHTIEEMTSAQARTIQAQTVMKRAQAASARKILQLKKPKKLSTTLILAGIVSDDSPLDSLESETVWFLGNQMKLSVDKGDSNDTFLWLELEKGCSTTFDGIEFYFKGELFDTEIDLQLPRTVHDGSQEWNYPVWKIDAETAKQIKKGKDVQVVITQFIS
jgi:hypothetical protein